MATITAKEAIARVERERARIKRQNEKQKERIERVSAALPIGTKARIAATGENVNKLINRLVLGYLDEYERTHQTVLEPEEPKELKEPEEPKTPGNSHFWDDGEELPF